ncbi:MAG: hypothetical protein U9R74_11565 [Pseudomonadota bacterium]|nr:hypothetical protein [Pseudomonadota bacterium]
MKDSGRHSPGHGVLSPHDRNRDSILRKLVPILIFGTIGLIILYNAVPAFRMRVEQLIDPDAAAARGACLETALAATSDPGFARVLDPGEVDGTPKGHIVRGVVTGEMGPEGGEIEFSVDCHVDAAGRIVKSQRSPRMAAAPTGAPSATDSGTADRPPPVRSEEP